MDTVEGVEETMVQGFIDGTDYCTGTIGSFCVLDDI